ncbi:MAG: RDD family protein [Fuerstiella sp.]
MPIKVRCQDCETVLKLSDKAAGRAVKCKSCGAKVQVPGQRVDGEQPASSDRKPARGRKTRKRRPAPVAPDNDDMFGQIDLRRAESKTQICPSCTAEIQDEEAFMCPECGVDLDTGKLSVQESKRRSRGGPPPEEFYGAIWGNAWTFVMNHKKFVLRTGFTWGISLAMVAISAFTLNWFIPAREAELIDSAEGPVEITENGVVIEPTQSNDAKYDGTTYNHDSSSIAAANGRLVLPTPYMGAVLSPPTYFWTFIFCVFFLGMTGWAWTLSARIVEVTLAKQKKIKRFQGDIFGDMTRGFTTVFWPVMVMYPVIWIPGAMYAAGMSVNACAIAGATIFLAPYTFLLPLAVVHMAQPFTYRSWLANWMGKDFLSTIGPSLYISLLFFLLVMLPPLAVIIGAASYWPQVADFYFNSIEIPVIGFAPEDAGNSWTFALYRMPFLFFFTLFVGTFFMSLLAVPAIFMMRVFGLFGLYFRPDMSLCVEEVEFTDVGFGPRFLAIHVDAIVVTIILAAMFFVAGLVSWLFGFLYDSQMLAQYVYFATVGIGTIGLMAIYFGKGESGAGRCTLGKWSLGLIVLQEDGAPMPFELAAKRFFVSLLSIVSLSGTFAMCAFNPQHRALHDTATKTKVVWRSEED